MKILFILENYYPNVGGAEFLFKSLAEGLIKGGHQVTVLTHKSKNSSSSETINGVKIYRQNCFYSRYLFSFFSILKAIKLAKNNDLIQTVTYNGAFPAWVASKLTKKKSVITVLEVWVGQWRKLTEMGLFSAYLHNFLERLIYLLNFDKYICISKSTQNQLLKLNKKRFDTKIVYPGIDYNHWNPKKYDRRKIRKKFCLEKNFVYLFYGRPGTSKGLEYLIEAVPLISKKIPNSRLICIISKNSSYMKRYNKIINLIKKLKVNNRIVIYNSVPYSKLPSFISMADCVVVPSLAEGFGLTTVESCALSKPVVVSNIASLPEVVSGNYILVQPKNSEDIARGIESIYKKKWNNKPLKIFSDRENIRNYLNVYHLLLDQSL